VALLDTCLRTQVTRALARGAQALELTAHLGDLASQGVVLGHERLERRQVRFVLRTRRLCKHPSSSSSLRQSRRLAERTRAAADGKCVRDQKLGCSAARRCALARTSQGRGARGIETRDAALEHAAHVYVDLDAHGALELLEACSSA
jgi:hypothetical protein